MSFQHNLRATYYTTAMKMLRQAMRSLPRQGCVYVKTLEWAQRVVLDGAYFLITADEFAGHRVMNAVESLEHAGLGRLAHLAGIIATLIAAAERLNKAQGKISGEGIAATWPHLLNDAKDLWRLSRRPVAAPAKIIYFRQAA